MIEKYNHFKFSANQLTTTAFTVFFIFLPLIYSNEVIETASLPRFILITCLTSLLLLTAAFHYFSTRKINIQLIKLHYGLLIFFIWALLSIFWSLDYKNTIIELSQLTSYLIIFLIASQLKNSKQITKIIIAILIGATIAAIIGILQAFNLNPLDLKTTTPLASTFNNKNHASVYFDLVIPLAFVSMFVCKSYSKYISSLAYTLCITFIFLSKTKGSLLGFFIFSLFFLLLLSQNKSIQQQLINKKNIIQYLFLTFIVPLFLYFLTTISFTGSSSSSTIPPKWNAHLTDNSASVRFSHYKNAFAMFKEQPILGVGYGAFRKGFTPYAYYPNNVRKVTEDRSVAQLHNDPYQNFLELGIIGGSLIIIIFSYIVFKSTSILSNQKIKNTSQYILLACLLSLTSSITHSLFDFPMKLPSSAVLFWFITGLIASLLNKEQQDKGEINWLNTNFIAVVIIIFTTLFSIHNFDLYRRAFLASKLQLDATVQMIKSKTNCTNDAREKMDQALNLFFESHSIRNRYAQVYSFCNLPDKDKLKAMNKVLNYDSTLNRARLTRANIYLNKRMFKLATSDFDYLISVLPHRPAAYLGLGDVATLNKEYKKARKYYEKAQKLDNKNQKASFMLKQFNDNGI